MRYGILAAGLYLAVKKSFSRELALSLGPRGAGRITRAAKARFREMILRSPPTGERKNPFSVNILMAALGASLYLTAKDVMSPEEMGGVFSRAIENTPAFRLVMRIRSKKIFTARWQDRLSEVAIASRAMPYPAGFVLEFIPGKTRDEYGVSFTECGICKLFQRERCTEFTPYMCRFDFVMARHLRCRLTRKHTIANGDGFCDFWYSNLTPRRRARFSPSRRRATASSRRSPNRGMDTASCCASWRQARTRSVSGRGRFTAPSPKCSTRD